MTRLGWLLAGCALLAWPAGAGSLDTATLQKNIDALAQPFDGRVGFCARVAGETACLHGAEAFPLQSVMKLLVATAVMDAVDRGRLKLDDEVTLYPSDLSLNVQPLADLVRNNGSYQTTIGDLVSRMVVDSDSAATDYMVAKLGGPAAVQTALTRLGASGIRFDRDERHLQTETGGLEWQPQFVDAAVLAQARQAVSPESRHAAFAVYLRDPRDTATPEAMTFYLQKLASGGLLSKTSTAYLLAVLSRTRTFPTRLKAGLPPGWSIAHKTGTGGTLGGVTSATNDVGVLTAPDGSRIAVAAMLSGSTRSGAEQDRLIASLAQAVVDVYHSGAR